MKTLWIAILLVGGTEVEWQQTIAGIREMKDQAKALARIAELEKELTESGTVQSKARLGELIVRAKLSRVGFIAQGQEAARAIGLFEEILKTQPDNVQVLYLHARTCVAMPTWMGRQKAGVASLERLVGLADKKPGSVPYPEVFLMLAKQQPKTAAKTLRVGLRSFPNDMRLQNALGEKPAPTAKPDPAVAKDAKKRFLAALLANKIDFAVIDRALAAGEALHPKDHEYPLYRGLLRLWQLEVRPAAVTASEAVALFRKALELEPKDTRIYGWLGPLLYITGKTTGTQRVIDEGAKVMATGVEKNPEQNLFGRALAYRRTGTNKKQLVEDLYRTMELCAGKKMDRARFVPSPLAKDHPSCRDSEYAPHNIAGTLFWAGDYFLTQNDMVRARDAIEAALKADVKKTWPYRALAEQRLALLSGKDVKPARAPVSCALCHQK